MRGFPFGALKLVSSPLVREDNLATAPKGKRRMRTRRSIRNLFHESTRQSVRVAVDAGAAHPLDLDNGVVRPEPAFVGDLGQHRLNPPRFNLVYMTTRGTQQELAVVRMVGMVAGYVGLRGLKPVDDADSHEELQMPVDGQWRDLALLPLLQQRHEFVGGKRPVACQQFRVDGQPGWRQSLALGRAAGFGEFSPLRRKSCRFRQRARQPFSLSAVQFRP